MKVVAWLIVNLALGALAGWISLHVVLHSDYERQRRDNHEKDWYIDFLVHQIRLRDAQIKLLQR